MNFAQCTGLIYIAILCGGLVNAVVFYDNTIYDADQGKDWLKTAGETNDLNIMANYLEKSLILLEPYNGNPDPMFPSSKSDYNIIKTNIGEVITNCRKWGNLSDFAYQKAVDNLQTTIHEIEGHVETANTYLWINPYINPLGWILGLILLFGWVFIRFNDM